MFYNRTVKVSSSHNQSYTEIGSVYHGAYLSHILIVPPLRAYSGRGSVLFFILSIFLLQNIIFFFLLGKHIGLPLLVIYIFRSFVFVSVLADAILLRPYGYWAGVILILVMVTYEPDNLRPE